MGLPAFGTNADERQPEPDRRRTVHWTPEVRRSYPRYDVNWNVALQAEGARDTAYARVVNISRGGILIRTPERLDETRRHLVVFIPGEDDVVEPGTECPRCGESIGGVRLRARSTWARVLRQGRGGGGWAAALEFEALLEFRGDGGPGDEK